jgi:hypothetical protein
MKQIIFLQRDQLWGGISSDVIIPNLAEKGVVLFFDSLELNF